MQAVATPGYFSLGYGPKSNALAGATIATPQDSFAGATNPAGMAMVGKRFDFAFKAFNPKRDASLDTRAVGGNFQVSDTSAKNWFFIPTIGFSTPITDKLWFGLTAYANGGMNTSYSRNIYDESAAVLGAFAMGGTGAAASVPERTGTGTPNTGELGVDLAQVILAPTLAFKIHPKHSIGVSALLSAQSFEAKGLGNFQCFTPTAATNNPAACSPGGRQAGTPGFVQSQYLSDNGRDWAYGVGVRVGWVGEVLPRVSLGAAWTSKIYMTQFDDYKELFANEGRFDIPSHFQVGTAVRPLDSLQLSFDYQRIFYSGVNSVSNTGPAASSFGPSIPAGSGLLGKGNGLGFGWKDINIYRLGVQYDHNDKLALRAGYSWNDSPISDSEILFNIIAPAVITQHVTVGLSYSPNKSSEWSLTYIHAFHESQSHNSSAFGVPASISMHQHAIEIGYSWK
jgi:long-chain fatty acid transport protein